MSVEARLKAQALGLGFDRAGIARLGPVESAPAFERWLLKAESTVDKDLLWLARQNLTKNRLITLDESWANSWTTRLAAAPSVPGTSPVARTLAEQH